MLSTTTDYLGRPYTLSWPEIQAILDVTGAGRPVITPRFRLLDRDRLPVSTGLPVFDVNGYPDRSDLSPWAQAGSVTMDAQDDISRRLDSFTYNERGGITLNPWSHTIMACLDYWDSRNPSRLLFEVPLGVFSLTLSDRELAAHGEYQQVTLLDTTEALQTQFLTYPWTCKLGDRIFDTMLSILTLPRRSNDQGGSGATPDGRPAAGAGFTIADIDILDTSDETFTEDMQLDDSDSHLAHLNTLLTLMGFEKLRTNAMGRPQIKKLADWSAETPTPTYTYVTGETSTIKGSVMQRFNRAVDKINYQRVTNGLEAEALIDVVVTNDSAYSALSIANLDAVIMGKTIVNADIPSEDVARLLGVVAIQQAARLEEQPTLVTFPMPFVEINDNVQLLVEREGRTLIQSPLGYAEEGCTISFDSHEHEHRLSKLVLV